MRSSDILELSLFLNILFPNSCGSDACYEITEEGKLEGMQLKMHAGREGVFDAEVLLSEENAPDGWEIQGKIFSFKRLD